MVHFGAGVDLGTSRPEHGALRFNDAGFRRSEFHRDTCQWRLAFLETEFAFRE